MDAKKFDQYCDSIYAELFKLPGKAEAVFGMFAFTMETMEKEGFSTLIPDVIHVIQSANFFHLVRDLGLTMEQIVRKYLGYCLVDPALLEAYTGYKIDAICEMVLENELKKGRTIG